MRAAVDFGLTNIDVVVRASPDAPPIFTMLPGVPLVDEAALERALAASGHDLAGIELAAVTGGQHRRLPDELDGLPIVKVSEVTAIGRGGLYLARLPEALVVSAGSGTAMIAARGRDCRHVTGSAVGGGTLQGLGRLLLGTADALEIDTLAQAGDSNKADLTLKEATGGVLGRLPADANAVNFGRVARPGVAVAREDIAAALAVMVGQVIAVIAINAARAEGLRDIVVVGHLVDLPSVRAVLRAVAGYYSASISVPPTPGDATALGALLAAEDMQ
jgi:type II pantothenate kinase